MASLRSLKTVIFLGSARNVVPSWGGEARLGTRVLKWVMNTLDHRREIIGDETIQHKYHIVDPHEVFAEDGALGIMSAGELTHPTFMVADLPPKTQELKDIIKGADCYIIVSPEYNHSIPPALASVMGHFGGSVYACKPSAIVTYSPGPWGGMRAAMQICNMCHELGCLPVSKLCGIPTASQILKENGEPTHPDNRMLKQLPSMLTQLEWMAIAMKNQRDKVGVF